MYKYTGVPEGFAGFLRNCLHMKIKTLSEAVVSYNERSGVYDNLTEKQLYYLQCQFKFSSKLYKHIIGNELLKDHKWFSSQENNSKDGLVRDHRVSRNYGWLNKINPKLISHPANCEFMVQIDNSSKNDNCSITLEELLLLNFLFSFFRFFRRSS